MAKRGGDKPLAEWEKAKIARNQARMADLREQGATLGWVFSYEPKTTDGAAAVSNFFSFAEAFFKAQAGRVAGGKAHGEPYAERDRWLRERAAEYRAQNSTLSDAYIADRIVEGPLKKKLNIFDQGARKSADLYLYADATKWKKEKKIWNIQTRQVRRIIGKK